MKKGCAMRFFKSWLLPGARTADPRRFIDFTILDELEKEVVSQLGKDISLRSR